MSDTVQVVRWTLGKTCRLRSAHTLHDPGAALAAVGRATTYARSLSQDTAGEPADAEPDVLSRLGLLAGEQTLPVRHGGFGLYGDVCVTATTTERFPPPRERTRVTFPADGFSLSTEFAQVGGPEGLRAMCRDCPANTASPLPAGCAGTLYRDPEAPETEGQLRSAINRLGLGRAVADSFVPTQPLWYGLWARSPLSSDAADVLRRICGQLRAQDAAPMSSARRDRDHLAALDAFLSATLLAESHGLTLAVDLSPPGHVDFGQHTIFPHCPTCKAEAPGERWRPIAPSLEVSCPSCGGQYRPAETHRADQHESPTSLKQQLGPQRYRAFVVEYLISNGLSSADASDAVAGAELADADRQRRIAEQQDRGRRVRAYIRQKLYPGLRPLNGPDADEIGTFDAHDTAELLRRAAALKFSVGMLQHTSADPILNRLWTAGLDLPGLRRSESPDQVLARWLAAGCRERFTVALRVSDDRLT